MGQVRHQLITGVPLILRYVAVCSIRGKVIRYTFRIKVIPGIEVAFYELIRMHLPAPMASRFGGSSYPSRPDNVMPN
jgi:hypothetical protein